MDLDREEDEDDIKLGSNGTMDDIQDEETSVHSQEIEEGLNFVYPPAKQASFHAHQEQSRKSFTNILLAK